MEFVITFECDLFELLVNDVLLFWSSGIRENVFVMGTEMNVIAETPISRKKHDVIIVVKYCLFVIVCKIFLLLIRVALIKEISVI